jgi:transposase InsO family protein
VARFLLKLVGWFGRPKGIRTDGGSQYDNHLIDTFCHLLGFDRHVTLAYRPQANGKVERVNKEVGRHLRFICLDRRFENKWSSMLPLVQRSINTQIHEVLGVEPARIVFGGFQTMDRFMLPDTISGTVQQGIAAIPAKDRRLVVGEYVKHLVDTQAVIIKCAQEYQHKYLKSRKKSREKTP